MSSAGSGTHDPSDWRWQLRHVVRTVDELCARLELSADELAGARRAERAGMPLAITPYYLSLCAPRDPGCPIRRQVVPHLAEGGDAPGELVDPLGEERHEVAPGLVQRYPDRALLIATDRCAVHCRFCTRSRLVGAGHGPLEPERPVYDGVSGPDAPRASPVRFEAAMRYLTAHPEIRELIVSGGDPLALGTARLVRLLERVRSVPHLEIVRLATRAPVVLPQRIDAALCAALRPFGPLWVMTHFNHPAELTAEAARACALLCDGGFPVMNQTVLLAGVNDDAETLAALFRGLVRWRVRPYYLHQMDPVRGTAHLRTPLARGIALMEQLQGRVSGLCLPKLIVDTPGGMGKVPVGPDWIVARAPGRTTLRTHRGVSVDYFDPPDSVVSGRNGG